jgi:ectoine hydroxylase-related dioxygenase (phytanoyl-CoA dioxygenase family)
MGTLGSSKLTPEQHARYREQGYYFPLRVFDEAEAGLFRERFEEYLAQNQKRVEGVIPRERRVIFSQTHLMLHWVYQIVSNPNVLDAVESVLGPDLLVWETGWFFKSPKDKAFVSWHQDGTYWGIHPPNVVTAWVALSESNPENGCLRVIPRTHKTSFLSQRETYARDNMLSRGQEIAVEVDESLAVDLVLRPGEMSLHHVAIVHGSKANTSEMPRIGIAIRFTTPDVVQESPERQIVHLVRGKDRYGHFDIVEPPREGIEGREIQAEALRRVLASILPRDSSPGKVEP